MAAFRSPVCFMIFGADFLTTSLLYISILLTTAGLLPLIACTFRLLVLRCDKGQAHRRHTTHRCHINVENPSPAKSVLPQGLWGRFGCHRQPSNGTHASDGTRTALEAHAHSTTLSQLTEFELFHDFLVLQRCEYLLRPHAIRFVRHGKSVDFSTV